MKPRSHSGLQKTLSAWEPTRLGMLAPTCDAHHIGAADGICDVRHNGDVMLITSGRWAAVWRRSHSPRKAV